MSAEKDWLTILQRATSYIDLQNVFARMSVEAKSTDDGDALVASIDEAIRRIEQERTRDQAELDDFSSEYEAFKQEQSGVIGWLKRKLPFTETRKQELGHRDALSDQAAEILADNFVIARAQMLKERIASAKLRRMGQQTAYWRNQFLNNDSVGTIREYGSIVHALGKELSLAKLFVDTVSIEIDAFSSAKFIDKDDQLRRNDDLSAAKVELKALADELQEKANLRNSALLSLKRLLISELSEKDVDFRNTNHRLALLKNLQDKHPNVAKPLEERLAALKSRLSTMVELDSLPDRREKIEKSLNILSQHLEDAEAKRLRASSEWERPSQLYHAALIDSQQANASLKATKPLYDAYVAEQNRSAQNIAEVTSDSDFDVSISNVVTEYRRLEEAATKSTQMLRERTPIFEKSKRALDDAVNEAKAIREKSDTQVGELKKIADLEAKLQQQMHKATQSIESTFQELRIAAASYLQAARMITWSDSVGASVRSLQELFHEPAHYVLPPSHFSFERSYTDTGVTKDLADLRRDSERLAKTILELETNGTKCRDEFTSLSKLRKEALQRRGQMLFDLGVCSELDFN